MDQVFRTAMASVSAGSDVVVSKKMEAVWIGHGKCFLQSLIVRLKGSVYIRKSSRYHLVIM